MSTRIMACSTATLRQGDEVVVLDTIGETLNVMLDGQVHTIMAGDLVDEHEYCEHDHQWCLVDQITELIGGAA